MFLLLELRQSEGVRGSGNVILLAVVLITLKGAILLAVALITLNGVILLAVALISINGVILLAVALISLSVENCWFIGTFLLWVVRQEGVRG